MNIFNFRSGFITTIFALSALACLISPALMTFTTIIVCIGSALLVASLEWTAEVRATGGPTTNQAARLPWTSYTLGGLTLATAGVVGAIIGHRFGVEDPISLIVIGVGLAMLTVALLAWRWNGLQIVGFSEQANMSTLFGFRRIRGPTRFRPLPRWLGRVVSVIGLRMLKTDLVVEEIDTREGVPQDTAHLRVVNGGRSRRDEQRAYPTRIHSITLSVSYCIDGERWYMLNDIPNANSRKQAIRATFESLSPTQPVFWDQLVESYVREEVPEVLRRVVHQQGWNATTISEDRNTVAEELLSQLRREIGPYAIQIMSVEINSVAVESPQAERAARNLALHLEHHADGQLAILRQAQRLLNEPNLPPAFAAFLQSVIIDLSYQNRPSLIVRTERQENVIADPQPYGDHRQREAA
jgi:hypothetical protein